jgi:hypothetical protein
MATQAESGPESERTDAGEGKVGHNLGTKDFEFLELIEFIDSRYV